ncbi:MAG: hypothetical protein P8011_15690 [Acidihalobacter sp.]
MNKLTEELSTRAIAETRFRARVAKSSMQNGLNVLDKLDKTFGA